jgi:DNA-binding IclR family transcriptional regulator
MAQLMEIRQQGYAVSCGERIAGVICLSTPVKNYTYPAALSIIGPSQRLEPKLADLAEALKASAKRISGNIDGIFK